MNPLRYCQPILILVVLAGCEDKSLFEESCGGEPVPNCLPYQYSIVEEASIEPSRLTINDVSQRAQVRVRLSTCSGGDVTHTVALSVQVGDSDAGDDLSIIDLLTLADDGSTEGDETAGDGMIDVDIPNPFIGERLPENQDVTLRFVSRARPDCSGGMCIGTSCISEPVDVPYRLGGRQM